MNFKIPKRWQGLLWSTDIENLNFQKDKVYIIHQILNHGDISDWKLLFRLYSIKTVKQVFKNHPYRNYRPARFNLIKNFLLKIKKPLNPKKYVVNTPGNIR